MGPHVGQYDQLYRSENNGQNWDNYALTGIAAIYYNAFSTQVYAINDGMIYVSLNNGQTWNPFYSNSFGNGNKEIIASDNGFVFVSGSGVVYKLDQNGNLLKIIDLVGSGISTVDIALSKNGRLFLFELYRSYYSDDYGENFQSLFTSQSSLDI